MLSLILLYSYSKRQKHLVQKLIENLQFVEVNEFTIFGRIPKIGTSIEKNILAKVFKQHRLQTFLDTKGKPIYYRTTGGRYFKVVTNYPTGSTKEKPLLTDLVKSTL